MRRKLKPASECSLEELGMRYVEHVTKCKQYYQTHKQEQLVRNKKWRKLNPEKYKESDRLSSKKKRKNPNYIKPANDVERRERKLKYNKKYNKSWYQRNKSRIAEEYKAKKLKLL